MAEWLAYANLYGLPQVRADFRAGQICAVSSNIHRGKDAEPFQPSDFIPSLRPPEEPLEPDEPVVIDIEATSKALASLLGKRDPQ